jgi:hypothetical protein
MLPRNRSPNRTRPRTLELVLGICRLRAVHQSIKDRLDRYPGCPNIPPLSVARLLRFQRRHVDGKAILNVRPNHPLVSFVDLLDRNDFYVGRNGVRAECVSELHSHVAKPAKTNNADLFALRYAPVTHRRVGRDAGTKQRGGPSEIDIGCDVQNEAFIHHNAVGVAAVGDRRRLMPVGTATGRSSRISSSSWAIETTWVSGRLPLRRSTLPLCARGTEATTKLGAYCDPFRW